jgi:hypothetical protein
MSTQDPGPRPGARILRTTAVARVRDCEKVKKRDQG